MKKGIAILLLMVGIAAIVLGIVCYSKYEGGYASNYTYGGDAYTGIQNAAAQTARNILFLTRIVRFGFGSVLMIGGMIIGFVAINGLGSSKATEAEALQECNEEKEIIGDGQTCPEQSTVAQE